jgi:hypothetical protein
MASEAEHMRTKALIAEKKNASCMVKPFKSVKMEALLLFIKIPKMRRSSSPTRRQQ